MAALQKPQAANLADGSTAGAGAGPPLIRAGFKGAPPLLLYVGVLHPIMFGVAWLVCDTPLVLLGVALTRY